jgi:hypothetical protein
MSCHVVICAVHGSIHETASAEKGEKRWEKGEEKLHLFAWVKYKQT